MGFDYLVTLFTDVWCMRILFSKHFQTMSSKLGLWWSPQITVVLPFPAQRIVGILQHDQAEEIFGPSISEAQADSACVLQGFLGCAKTKFGCGEWSLVSRMWPTQLCLPIKSSAIPGITLDHQWCFMEGDGNQILTFIDSPSVAVVMQLNCD